jgi:hypothetical protein
VKWSGQMCRSVTVTEQAVLNTVMKFCGTQTLRIAGAYGRRQATEQTQFNGTVLNRNQYEILITKKLIIELLSIMTQTMCSSVSAVNTLLQWYLHFFFVCFICYWPVFFTGQRSANNR